MEITTANSVYNVEFMEGEFVVTKVKELRPSSYNRLNQTRKFTTIIYRDGRVHFYNSITRVGMSTSEIPKDSKQSPSSGVKKRSNGNGG